MLYRYYQGLEPKLKIQYWNRYYLKYWDRNSYQILLKSKLEPVPIFVSSRQFVFGLIKKDQLQSSVWIRN